MKNLDYRAFGATFKLILLVWLTFVLLLLLGKVTAADLVNVTITGVFGWVLRDGATKVAEAYRDKGAPSGP
jgi:hypothetical protein